MRGDLSSTTRPSRAALFRHRPASEPGREDRPQHARSDKLFPAHRVQLGGGLTEADEGDYLHQAVGPGDGAISKMVMSEIRTKVEHDVPGLEIETAQLMEDLIGDLTAVPQPIEVKLFGDDPQQLEAGTAKVVGALEKINGVVEVASGLRVAGDAIIIHVDRAAASVAGLDPDQVSKQVETDVGGTVATQVLRGEQVIDVRIRLPQELRQRAEALRSLTLRAADGRSVPLSSIAQITIQAGQRQITREDLAPFIPVTARLEGKDLGTGMAEVQAAVAALHLPPSVRVDYGGLYQQQKQSFRDLRRSSSLRCFCRRCC